MVKVGMVKGMCVVRGRQPHPPRGRPPLPDPDADPPEPEADPPDPEADPPVELATEAGGMHPTDMHSC